MIDRDRADITWRRLFKDKAIVTRADRYRVVASNINRVVAIADRYLAITSV